MDSFLLVTLSITGLLAVYWVLFGQWKWNKTFSPVDKPVNDDDTKSYPIDDIKE